MNVNDHMMNNVDQYGDGYMEPEEEWEREGLLDPAWEKQQKKVGTLNFCYKLSSHVFYIIFYVYTNA